MIDKIVIYCDGACSGNPGVGGWGAVIIKNGDYENREKINEGYRLTTNNRMELRGFIHSLERYANYSDDITVYSDSRYVTEAINQGWVYQWQKKNWKKVKNPDLWKRAINLVGLFKPKIVWVEGHSGDLYNEEADVLAKNATKSIDLNEDTGYKKG